MKSPLFFLAFLASAAWLAGAPPAGSPGIENEQLNYAIDWPSGLSLGEAHLNASASKSPPDGSGRLDLAFSIDAAVPGFRIFDQYHSQATPDFCSLQFDRKIAHGNKKTEDKTLFDAGAQTATRETVGGGKSGMKTPACARDALDFLYFVRSELNLGLLPPAQPVFFGSKHEISVEFAGAQTIRLEGQMVEADRLNATLKGPSSSVNFEIYFLQDAARTPALVRIPLPLSTFTMELVRQP